MPASTGDRGGADTTCATCGRPARSGEPCPHCGHRPEGLDVELAKVERALSELATENLDLDKQRRELAARMQAAKHQRDVLARALSQRAAGTGRTPERARRTLPGPRRPGRLPPAARRPARPVVARGRPVPRMRVAPVPEQSTEASSGSVQALMLGLGALLFGIAAVVFVGVAITTFEAWGQLAILVGTNAAALTLPPLLARRGLVSTAETISVVGLVLVGVVGYSLWATDAVAAIPGQTFAGVVAAATAAAGYGYHRLTGLAVPRTAGLLAAQPALPLLFYPVVSHPAAWAAVFALVAIMDGVLGRLDRDWPDPLAGWQRHLAWVWHGLALGAAAGYAITALAQAGTVLAAARAGSLLVATAAVGVGGTLALRQRPLPDLAAGLMTLAVVASAARVAVVAAPGHALLLVSGVAAAIGMAGRSLPAPARRGPQLASAAVLAVLGALVTALALRAGVGTVVFPPWPAGPPDATPPPDGPGWHLAVTAAVLTVAAVVALPPRIRREATTAGVAVTAIAVPASFGLSASRAAWVLVVVAAGLALTGRDAATTRAAVVHLAAGAAVAVTGIGAALATPVLTAAILGAVAVTGAVVAAGPGGTEPAQTVSRWAAGGAALALPGATATAAAAAGAGTSPVLALGSAGACVSLGYAVRVLLLQRVLAVPVTVGAGAGAAAVAVAAVAAPDAAAVDIGVAALLAAAAALVYFTPRIDATRRRDRQLDGADLAAATVTAGAVATLARITWLALPVTTHDAALAVAGLLVGVVAVGVRTVPRRVRRGPALGVAVSGALVASVAAAAAVVTGARVIGTLWQQDLTRWPPPHVDGLTWATPLTLLLLAVAAWLALPRPRARLPGGAHASAALAVLAVVAAPVALGLDWWWPATLAAVAGAGYAAAAVGIGRWLPVPARTARAHGGAAAALGVYAAGAGVARPWTLALVLGAVVLVGVAVAAATATHPGLRADPRLPVGGMATTGVLLALPGALAALAVHLGRPGAVPFLAALAGSAIGLAALAVLTVPRGRTPAGPGTLADAVRPYLPYGTVGVAAGATAAALAAVPTAHPAGVYAAGAVLLAVAAELLRTDPAAPGGGLSSPRPLAGWVNPAVGALLAAAVPTAVALIQMAPALRAALVDPLQVVADVWDGPPAALLHTAGVPATSALAALLLTLAAALAAAGFGGAVTRQSAPVVAPGLAITLLISPAALGAPWPAGTVAALAVFTLAMLGVALTPPPPAGVRNRVLRWTRGIVLVIGLAAGGAGLAGSLADEVLTWGTFGGAVGVGVTAALGGRTLTARLLGWSGAAVAANLFALTTASLVGVTRYQAATYLLPVAAVALLVAARLPRLRTRPGRPERRTVEWLGGYLTLLLAAALAYGSPPDVAALLAGAGLVLGVDAMRRGRPDRWRTVLLWAAAACETGAVWIMVWLLGLRVLEAYTLPLAAFALVVGWLESRRRPQLTSWVVLGPGIVFALVPSLLAVVPVMEPQPVRQAWVLLGGAGVLVLGSRRRQRAPVILGSTITAAGALHLLSLAGPWLVLIPLAVLFLYLGGQMERRRRDLARIRGALGRMR